MNRIIKVLGLTVLVVLIALLGVSGVLLYSVKAKSADTPRIEVGPIYETEEFTVNLSESINHYIKAKFAIELSDKKAKEELEEKLPLLQDTVIMILSGQTLDKLGTVEGKEELKKLLLESINGFLYKGKVNKIYFKNIVFS
ncbi:MAG: flagellar basal body-associated FliL family protein [Peptococcaceae bacterium]|jgi:flagellar FliL protein|nr:flagellar basal body-associated FliL family protein [Peptococcaceae bacterium]MDH7524045.1 flagellar basal body-associated FliL family protein [Peptococcaceae bacterium]